MYIHSKQNSAFKVFARPSAPAAAQAHSYHYLSASSEQHFEGVPNFSNLAYPMHQNALTSFYQRKASAMDEDNMFLPSRASAPYYPLLQVTVAEKPANKDVSNSTVVHVATTATSK